MTDYRCRRCGRLLFRADAAGRVEIACPNRQCRTLQTIAVATAPQRLSTAVGIG